MNAIIIFIGKIIPIFFIVLYSFILGIKFYKNYPQKAIKFIEYIE